MGCSGVTCHMREQSSKFPTRLPAGALFALALLLFVGLGRAGEPIQFSNDKAKQAPTDPGQQVDTELFKGSKSKRPPAARLNGLTPYISLGPNVDPKDERRMKNIREEKKNWMLLEPGELQKRDEDEEGKFGGKGVAIDSDEVKDGNYLFYNVTGQRSDKPVRAQNAPTEEDQPKKDNRSLNVFGPREAEQSGAHTAKELNLKNLIDPAQVNAMKNNDTLLFQFLKDNSPTPPDRDQQARRDNFRDFINGPQSTPAPSGISDPINFRTDLTQERINPVTPSRPGLEMSSPMKAPDGISGKPTFSSGFTPGRPAGLPDIVGAAPRQPMTGPSLPSPFLTPNDATKAPRASVMGNGSLFNRDAPRRGGL